MITTALLLAASALSSTPVAPAAPSPRGDEVGSISGRVVWEGERPAPKPDLVMEEKASVGCKHHDGGMDKKDDTLLVGESGGVANVVLTLEIAGQKPAVPAEPVVMDQLGCRFHPHVAVVPVGGTIRFANSDDTNHNIHTFSKKNQPINKQVAAGGNLDLLVDKAEPIEVKCDVHAWMKSYAIVTDATKFAISAADGSFKLDGLPPGEYELSWWHEELGKGKTEKVKVEAGKDTALEHKVSAEKKGAARRR